MQDRGPHHGARPWAGWGLRARVTAAFAVGAFAVSATMVALTYLTARQFILHQRETAIVRQAEVNASLIRSSLPTTSGVPTLIDSLDTAGSHSVLFYQQQWFTGLQSISFSYKDIPPALRTMVLSGTPATQHYLLQGSPQMVVGIPVPSVHASYFEVFDLSDPARTLRILALVLSGAALVTTISGAALGRWASGRALRPLGQVSQAAETIAGGRLDARLSATDDADLAPLASSFNRMAAALQERIEHEVRFTSDVSHELRSPLTTVAASLGVLEAHARDLTPRGRRAVELLSAELHRFQRMVDDLLEISRVDTGSAELSLDEVRVGELVHQASTTGGARGVPVQVDPAVADLRLWVDKRRIDRVISNLVGNAAQYAGGATLLAAEPAPGAVRLVVVDHGPGVAPEERERIFERFYRGQVSGRRGDTEGTGLGLSLVAEHVKLHGGRVWVETGPSGENRFVVELPRGWGEDAPPSERGRRSGRRTGSSARANRPDRPNRADNGTGKRIRLGRR
jgi:two-component system, OmpR family, sensor histidine kinase MtrB